MITLAREKIALVVLMGAGAIVKQAPTQPRSPLFLKQILTQAAR